MEKGKRKMKNEKWKYTQRKVSLVCLWIAEIQTFLETAALDGQTEIAEIVIFGFELYLNSVISRNAKGWKFKFVPNTGWPTGDETRWLSQVLSVQMECESY
jgi:hypothetical protein